MLFRSKRVVSRGGGGGEGESVSVGEIGRVCVCVLLSRSPVFPGDARSFPSPLAAGLCWLSEVVMWSAVRRFGVTARFVGLMKGAGTVEPG